MIGRKKEIEQLNRLYESGKSEFVAVYGRRRVGKTYLIDQTFKGRITFRHAGVSPVEASATGAMEVQLDYFYRSLVKSGMKETKKPQSWADAFDLLEAHLESIEDGERMLLFIDELPWLDTPRSGFVTALEAFWNGWACHRENVMLVVCGSASSWILDKLIHNHGGLYNRLTYQMKLSPFDLRECDTFFKFSNITMSKYDVVQSYMVVGGIPYYLGYFIEGLSLSKNIDNMFFNKNALLKNEFDDLFSSVFSSPDEMKKIVSVLSTKGIGYTRNELLEKTKKSSGGSLSNQLNALIASDFIIKYSPYNNKKEYYKLIDPFCLFYLHFVNSANAREGFWSKNTTSPKLNSWRGLAFENVCFNHVNQIKTALGISDVECSVSSLYDASEDRGAQIDMILSRNDNVVNMCEIKFYSNEFSINKDYFLKLNNKLEVLQTYLNNKQVIYPVMISTYGLKKNEYSSFFYKTLTLEELFG